MSQVGQAHNNQAKGNTESVEFQSSADQQPVAGIVACDGFLAAVEIIDRRWSSLIVQAIAKGCTTFSQISCYADKLNDSSLSKRLKELESTGIVQRSVADARPPKVTYGLTTAGRELVPILDALTAWGNRNLLTS